MGKTIKKNSGSTDSSKTSNDLLGRVNFEHPNWQSRHIAIVMDGNGRWAKARGFADRIRGHEAATDAVRSVVETCARLHLRALTLYAFSKENWSRPKSEVNALMRLLRRFLVQEREEMMENNIRFIATGCLEDLPKEVLEELETSRQLTEKNTGLVVNLAVSYSGREEITQAARALARLAVNGKIKPEDIKQEDIARHLYAPELGDPDLFIRTSGEMRISNFLLWQIAYSELVITDVLWPDFRAEHLIAALLEFQNRKRRYGAVS